ncbi:hypothetical protein O988_03327, partial [Pseudogymnoascus sp. VKM F-3808]
MAPTSAKFLKYGALLSQQATDLPAVMPTHRNVTALASNFIRMAKYLKIVLACRSASVVEKQFLQARPLSRQVARSSSLSKKAATSPNPTPFIKKAGQLLERESIPMSEKPEDPRLSPPTVDDTKIIPTSQERVKAEVQRIYIRLLDVEKECKSMHEQAQLGEATAGAPFDKEKYQAALAKHWNLLHEHYNLYLACQQPSATRVVRLEPNRRYMPERLWNHGIYGFLELLGRSRAPLNDMFAFINNTYSFLSILHDKVPTFQDKWTLGLGSLAWYRMAMEDSQRNRVVCGKVAREWFLKSANLSPENGHPYYYLAKLAYPDLLLQLLYFGKSLAVPTPFTADRESIMTTLFEPTLNPAAGKRRYSAVITAIVRSHAIIFTGQSLDTFDETLREIKSNFDRHAHRQEILRTG